MKRLLCIWFPNWPIQRFLVARPELVDVGTATASGRPAEARGLHSLRHDDQAMIGAVGNKHPVVVLLNRDRRRGQLVVACSRAARRQGVFVGMPLPEAMALLDHGARTNSRRAAGASGSRRQTPVAGHEEHLAQLGIWPHDPAADQQTLEGLVSWAEAYSPIVGLDQEQDSAEGLLLDITAVADRHGGERQLAQRLAAELRAQQYWAQFGIADTLGAAWALAHWGHTRTSGEQPTRPSTTQRRSAIYIAPLGQTLSALNPLPVTALRLSAPVVSWLAELGVQYIEQLADLPRAGIASRLGAEVVRRWDQALGHCSELFIPHRPLPSFLAQWQAEHPTDREEVVQRVVEHLSQHLAEQLSNHQQGALQLRCRLFCDAQLEAHDNNLAGQACSFAEPIEFEVSLFQPTLRADYLWQLLRGRLEQISLPGPIAKIELSATATARLHQQQALLWQTEQSGLAGTQLAQLVDRLSNRLGPQAVTAARLRTHALPEWASVQLPLTGPAASSARLRTGFAQTAPLPEHRPLQLIHPPRPIQMVAQSNQGWPQQFTVHEIQQHVLHSWGPERIETAWWQGPCVRRDYYRVSCLSGSWFWLFFDLQERSWFLHGEFI